MGALGSSRVYLCIVAKAALPTLRWRPWPTFTKPGSCKLDDTLRRSKEPILQCLS